MTELMIEFVIYMHSLSTTLPTVPSLTASYFSPRWENRITQRNSTLLNRVLRRCGLESKKVRQTSCSCLPLHLLRRARSERRNTLGVPSPSGSQTHRREWEI